MPDIIAETARLRLRTWDAADIGPFMARLNTPAVMRWLGGVQDDAAFRVSYDRIIACQLAHGHSFWIVERLSDNALLGFCGLKRVNIPGAPMIGDCEIGWRLAEDAQGHGYAREAAEASLTLAFNRFAAPHVVALTIRQNTASWGLMQRLGMIRARNLDFTDNRYGPEVAAILTYKIDRRDWTQ